MGQGAAVKGTTCGGGGAVRKQWLPELEAWHALGHSTPPAPPLIIFFISKFQNFNYVSPNTSSGLSFQQDAAQGE